jgi:hypothetical protein
MFGNSDKNHLPPVDESHTALQSQSNTPSLKRSQSSSTDSRSLPEMSSPVVAAPPPLDPKKAKKETVRMAREMAREAEMQRRAQMKKAQQEQSRAVMHNRNQIIMESQTKQELEWKWQSHANLVNPQDTSRFAGSPQKLRSAGGPIRDRHPHENNMLPYERLAKARKREFDDDHSMSSSDVRSSAVISVMSFATNSSDPGHSLSHRHRPFSSLRDSSTSSPLGHLDDCSVSATSDPSVSHHHFPQASMDSSSLSDLGSPPPIHTLSLSPAGSWRTLQGGDSADGSLQQPKPSRLMIPSPSNELPYGGHVSGHTPSPGLSAPKSAINPIFKVVSPFSAL